MHWQQKGMLVIAMLAIIYSPTGQAQETYTQTLHWRNGDVLPGRLLESSAGVVRWKSPYFSDDLSVDIDVLNSVVFPKRSVPATEGFRVGTVSGDVWIADIVDSDAETFLFSSKRHGEFRVNREAIYTLERRVHPNLIFEGSQLSNWTFPKRDPNDPRVLFKRDDHSDWYADRVGHPSTDKVKAKIFQSLAWPQHFEIDLELASAERPPGFVFALGKNLYETLRLETWVNELVLVQGTLFEPVLTIQPDRRSFRLRLVYDGDAGVLEVFDFAGNSLLKLEGVTPTVEEPGLYIYNRGQNLTVRRLRVYKHPVEVTKGRTDSASPRVRMMDGRVLLGKLFVGASGAYVLADDGTRHDIAVDQIDRLIQPGIALTDTDTRVALTYPDGAMLRGQIVEVKAESILLQTASVDTPIECSFAGASLLRLEPRGGFDNSRTDRLFHASGELRGHVLLQGKGDSLIRWQPVGAAAAVRLANAETMHIERNTRRAKKAWPFEAAQLPHVLHLKNGEIIPCQIQSYTEQSLSLHAPFIRSRLIASKNVKALEFSDRTHASYLDRRQRSTNPTRSSHILFQHGGAQNNIEIQEIRINDVNWVEGGVMKNREGPLGGAVELDFNKLELEDGKVMLMIDGQRVELRPGQNLEEALFHSTGTPSHQLEPKLERALTVPRFSRDTPPTHILVAENGDMRRGTFLGFNGKTIQFDSKLRRFTVPIERVTRVVEVSADSNQDEHNPRPAKPERDTLSQLCVRLTDGSILMFEAIEVKDDTLFGRSAIYGDVKVPVDSIQQLYFGDTAASFEAAFESWVVRPAKEPTFGNDP